MRLETHLKQLQEEAKRETKNQEFETSQPFTTLFVKSIFIYVTLPSCCKWKSENLWQNLHNNRVYNIGNRTMAVAAFWCVAGFVSGTISTSPILNEQTAFIAPLFVAFIFFLGYFLRKSPVMRKRRGWMLTVVMNLVVSTITTVVVIVHKATYKGVIAQMLTTIVMLALSEVMKPIVDFGMVRPF